MSFWAIVLFFVVAQNLQVALYGWAFNRTNEESATFDRIVDAFREPIFLASLLLLSVATAVCRLTLFSRRRRGSHTCCDFYRRGAVVRNSRHRLQGGAEFVQICRCGAVRNRHLPHRAIAIDEVSSALHYSPF